MKSPRPKRLRKERVPWEAAVASTLDTAKKAERKAPRTSKTDALKPIPLEPLPPSIERPHATTPYSKKTGQANLLEYIIYRHIQKVYLCHHYWALISTNDNNAVLSITTAYCLHQVVQRWRKRPGDTSTNARIVRPVFGDDVRKLL